MTTNCVLEPLDAYKDNIFTANETGVSGVAHVSGAHTIAGHKDFSAVIKRAKELPGFSAQVRGLPGTWWMGGPCAPASVWHECPTPCRI